MSSPDYFNMTRQELVDLVKNSDPVEKIIHLRHPWVFLSTCVLTTDEKEKTNATIKPFPTDKEYLKLLTKQWMDNDLLTVVKSRQLLCTWIFVALHLHQAISRTDQRIFFVSTDREVAEEVLMKRAVGIYERIPDEIWPHELLPKMRKKQFFMEFDDIGSGIQAMAKGKDQMRGYVGSAIFDDEGGFWDDAEETIATQRPATNKLTVVSTIPETFTAEPPFFWKLCYDGGKIMESDKKLLRKGYRTWNNKDNGFCAVELHFTADPEKDNLEWIQESKRGMSKKKWDREVDMKWTKSAGTPVYGEEFNPDFHICPKYVPNPQFEIIRGWDFGFNQCCVFGQFVDGRLYIFDEVLAEDHFPGESHVGTRRFAPHIKEYSYQHYKGFQFIDVVDPAGNAREQGSEDKIIKPMKDAGLHPILGEKLFETRRETVMQLLGRNKQGRPSFMIDPDSCPVSYSGLLGGYQYPEVKAGRITAVRPDRPLKNKYSHSQDCIQYIACYSLRIARDLRGFDFFGGIIPDLSYSFTDED